MSILDIRSKFCSTYSLFLNLVYERNVLPRWMPVVIKLSNSVLKLPFVTLILTNAYLNAFTSVLKKLLFFKLDAKKASLNVMLNALYNNNNNSNNELYFTDSGG